MAIGAILITFVIAYLLGSFLDMFVGLLAAICIMGAIILKRIEELEDKLIMLNKEEEPENSEET